MKTIEFKAYERAEGTLEEVGTPMTLAGKKGSVSFIPKNFADDSKRVAVIVGKADGTSAVISCSKSVSNAVRKHKQAGKKAIELLKWVAGLTVLQNEEGLNFISLPAGSGQLFTATAEELNKTTIDADEFVPSDLVAF